jgi:serine/threonine protein kinase
MLKFGEWEAMEPPLGSGGQGTVYKARTPARAAERASYRDNFRNLQNRAMLAELAESMWAYARPDLVSELGALKVFNIPADDPDREEALGRLRNEVATLRQNRSGMIKLLGANESEKWMATQFMPGGTIEQRPNTFKGNVPGALRAFRPLVETVAGLHKDKIVHRDIKPANVFVEEGQLVLGDFGIVYLPEARERLTCTGERVGSRTYMPPWGDMGERLDEVGPDFDVYMLGKLLWCMISGRLKLPFWYHKRPEFNPASMFPSDLKMNAVNSILDRCIVEERAHCLPSAQKLLEVVDEAVGIIESGAPLLDQEGKLSRPCRACGKGFYRSESASGTAHLTKIDAKGRTLNPTLLRVFVCNVCTHYEFFAPGNPDEAAGRGWRPWSP